MSQLRVGIGYDLHRLVTERPLILANIIIPHEKGLDGHSDADVVLHALIDALTGAAALPDVGQLFPNTDPRYKNIDSAQLLRAAMDQFTAAGWHIVNLDIILLAQRPKLSPHKAAMVTRLAQLLSLDPARINIKGKTGEHIGEIGREEAIACHCVALIEK